jgi:succinate-acetate transporter protein
VLFVYFTRNSADSVCSIADFQKSESIGKAGGAVGIATALVAFYCGLGELLTEDDAFTIPLGKYPPKSA